MNLKEEIREIQDYPKKGISFKDLTTLIKNKDAKNHNAADKQLRPSGNGIISRLLEAEVIDMRSEGYMISDGTIATQMLFKRNDN